MDGRSLIQNAATHDAADRFHGRDELPLPATAGRRVAAA